MTAADFGCFLSLRTSCDSAGKLSTLYDHADPDRRPNDPSVEAYLANCKTVYYLCNTLTQILEN